ncbi:MULTISPECIES: GNAT family N-acetyltransferase [unclassified Dickeya]|uniref:GNAT family N-acetyltransferase n=1 Tax=unclassified Dickeya TaxID=2622466 RepID=UPI00039B1FF5|nr:MULTISPECIES: GNAT family N-acetyltransferase [unclassified Dickeya]
MTIVIRDMTDADAAYGWSLTQQVHWPHRLEDWQEALQLGEGKLAQVQGEVVGTALCWRWGPHRATIGLVVVDTRYQGRGIGRLLMNGLLERLQGYQVRLHATAAGQGLYARLGFVTRGEIHQYQCAQLPALPFPVLAEGQRLRPAQIADVAALTARDSEAHGLIRPALIEKLMHHARCLRVLEQAGSLSGFAALRRFGRGEVIGPVIAGCAADARLLIGALLAERAGEFVRIDTPDALGLGPFLRTCGLQAVDAPVIMYRGEPWQPATDGMQAWALMSQAMA